MEGKRGREGEKHQCVFASLVPPIGDLACAPTGNQRGDPFVHRPALNPLSHTSQGSFFFIFPSLKKSMQFPRKVLSTDRFLLW